MKAAPQYRPLNLTGGNLWMNIWEISWPIILIMIFNFLVGITDVYVAGLISYEVQAAVGFITQIFFLNIIIANAVSIGTIAMISRAEGAGNYPRTLEIARQSLIMSIIIAIVLTAIGLAFYREIIAYAGFPDEIRNISSDFLKIFAVSLVPNYFLIISNAVFRASGDIKKPLFTMALVSVINVFGDFALVYGIPPFPRLGYTGIAFSTLFSVTAGMAVNVVFLSYSRWRGIYTHAWKVSLPIIKKVAVLGWPAAFLQIAWNAGSIVLYNILGRLGDTSITAIASLTNGFRIEAIIYLPAFALNMAASVLIGQNLGAGSPERAEQVGWKIAGSGTVLISLMALAIFLTAEQCASALTTHPGVLEETSRYLRINMLSEPFMAASMILGGCLQGSGDTRGTMWIIVTSMWFIRLPLAYVLGLVMHLGATGVWIAMIISMGVQGVLMTLRYRKGRWKELRVD
jgi:putative MATE family efflux protein